MGTDAVRSEVWGNRTKTAHDLRAYEPMLDLAADWLRAMAETTRLESEVTPLPELLGEKPWTVGAVPTTAMLEADTVEIVVDLGDETFQDGGK